MALKFRRGTTAQKSGSLAFGEPYVNTTLGTLQIGGPDGDITLGSTGTGSTGTFGAISGSGLDITGNANIGGNLTLGGQLTIGDNTSDTVNVVASLSSSLIPQTDNIFDLGSLTKSWRDLYISTGSIKMVSNGVVLSTLSHNANGFQLDQAIIANGDSSFGTSSAAVTSVTGSLRVSGSVAVIGSVSASTITGIGNVTAYSSSVDGRISSIESFSSSLGNGFATDAELGVVSASAWGAFQSASAYSASLATSISESKFEYTSFSASNASSDNTQTTNITAASASAWGAFQSASAYSASAAVVAITNANSAAGAFASASAYSASAAVVAITNANSAAGAFASASAYNASAAVVDNTQTTNITIASASAWGAFQSASAYSASAATTYAKLAVANTFTANQIVSGSITATGDVVAFSTSDKRHKHNIVLISDALSKVTKLNGVTWEWNEDVDDATKETPKTGLIAQEVQEVLPEVVKERADGFLALDYSKTIGLLVEAIKEQQTQIHSLTLEIQKLKKDNSL